MASDDEVLGYILSFFYNGGKYQQLDFYFFGKHLQDSDIHIWDIERFWRQLQNLGLIEPVVSSSHILYRLSDKGMELMKKYGTYTEYLKETAKINNKKDKIERNDRRVKNIGILTTLGVSLLTLILTQCPIRKDKEQEKTQEGIQSIATKLDSISKALEHTQTKIEKQPAGGTATSK